MDEYKVRKNKLLNIWDAYPTIQAVGIPTRVVIMAYNVVTMAKINRESTSCDTITERNTTKD